MRVDPVFPDTCNTGEATRSYVDGALIRNWTLTCALDWVEITGLDRTLTDVLVRHVSVDGTEDTYVLRAGETRVDLTEGSGASVPAYFILGVEHIIFGYDHLLFVAGIVLLVRRRQLLTTVTSFTVAHSLTLALSALAGVSLPGPPVEIIIALSITLLAVEALHRMRGHDGLGAKWPWAVALGFGLIHGFGFAGALSEIGLPEGARLAALLLFNIGVEAGQILVIALLLGIGAALARLPQENALVYTRQAAAYFIGVAGLFWVLERVTPLLTA